MFSNKKLFICDNQNLNQKTVMKRLFLAPLMFVLLIAASNYHHTIDGTWKGEFSGPQGSMEITFVFKTDGETLTGTSNAGMGEYEIKNGKVNADGESFSFDVSVQEMTITHKGKLNEDGTITLTVSIMDQENSMTLTKEGEDH